MSAFLVDKKTIDRVITHLDHEIRQSEWLKEKFEKELNLNFEDFDNDWKNILGQKMWDLNQLSLGYRYGDAKQELKYSFYPALETSIQAYKSLSCWLYQCCEGDIPEISKLYIFFDSFVTKYIAESIVMNSKEWDEGEWA